MKRQRLISNNKRSSSSQHPSRLSFSLQVLQNLFFLIGVLVTFCTLFLSWNVEIHEKSSMVTLQLPSPHALFVQGKKYNIENSQSEQSDEISNIDNYKYQTSQHEQKFPKDIKNNNYFQSQYIVNNNNNNNNMDSSSSPWNLKKNQIVDTTTIPKWMKEYLDWHSITLSTLSHDNWATQKYLVLRCFMSDNVCGGVSDRLKPLPLFLLAAYQSNRILFIHWTRPCPLEEFLIPPMGGLNWTMPNWLIEKFDEPTARRRLVTRASVILEVANSDIQLLQSHLHDVKGGATQYNEVEGDEAFESVYHDVFWLFFRPSPAVAVLVDQTLQQTGLIPGGYSVAHFRAQYGNEVGRYPLLREPSYITNVAANAINCASELLPGYPIYFASDSMIAINEAQNLSHTRHATIYTLPHEDHPLHLDKAEDEENRSPSDYYSTFVDLLLMGLGRCVAYGRGGFGSLASLISYNQTCTKKHVRNFHPTECKWVEKR